MDDDRTKDSIEQMDDRELKNPITDDDQALGETGDALIPQGEEPGQDKDDMEGPAPRTTQMPR